MRIRTLFFIFLLVSISLCIPHTASAQDEPTCDPSSLINTLAKLSPSGDEAKDMAALTEIRDQITAQNIACNGYTYTGNGNGVVKPIDLMEGLYNVHVVADSGVMNITLKVVSGKCSGSLGDTVMLISSMTGKIDDEALIESKGCRTAMEIQFAPMGKRDWTLTIEPLQ